METLKIQPETLSSHFMYSIISPKLTPKHLHISSQLRTIFSQSLNLTNTTTIKNSVLKSSVRTRAKFTDAQLKENWLASLSCPKLVKTDDDDDGDVRPPCNAGGGHEWVIGIDPDLSGALALLKSDNLGCTPQVFDTPILQIMVGKKVRRRLDASSIVKLLRSFDAPVGTVVYLEQSNPFPQDGKQGWWSGGFGYGLWIGVLVASGFSVVPVPACKWKNEFELSGSVTNKDDSRKLASTFFPSMNSLLNRKKDHGRAEALLIAAYGKGMKIKPNSSCNSQESIIPEILASC